MSPIQKSPEKSLPSETPAPQRRVISKHFQQGLFGYHRGDYSDALAHFERAAEAALQLRDSRLYLESAIYILRTLSEREEFSRITQIESMVLRILLAPEAANFPAEVKSQALYVIGICKYYERGGRFGAQPGNQESAMRRFHEAIDFAMQSDDRSILAPPLFGSATVHYAERQYDQALKELERLDVLLSCLSIPDLEAAAQLLRAMIKKDLGEHDVALEAAWQAFGSLKDNPHLVLYLHTLCVIGQIFAAKGDLNSARLYVDLAARSLKRDDLKRIARMIDEAQRSIGVLMMPNADLVYGTRTGMLWEAHKGEIRFEGQFILRDLLKVFLENPGEIFTKEDLAQRVWREPYNPKIHDNKIYVTIKRLRQILETDDTQANYILRAKAGYFLNPKVRVRINDELITPRIGSGPQALQ